jgi:tetratricopeptide (TPR) repeat protein
MPRTLLVAGLAWITALGPLAAAHARARPQRDPSRATHATADADARGAARNRPRERPRERPRKRPRKVSDTRRQAIARRHFRRGKRYLLRRRYEKAIHWFLKAYEYWDHPSVLYNLASAYALQGELVQSRVYLRLFRKHTGRNPRRLPRHLRRVLRKTAVLAIRIDRAPPQVRIYVDGRSVGHKEAELVVRPGQRVVEIRQGDRVLRRRTLEVPQGGERTWEIEQITGPRPPPRRAEKSPRPRPRPRQRLHWGYFTGAAAATVALFTAALGTSIENLRIHQEFEAAPTDEALASRGRRMQTAANVLWGLTAAAAAASAALVFFTRWKAGREQPPPPRTRPAPGAGARVRVQPGLGPGGVQLTVTW